MLLVYTEASTDTVLIICNPFIRIEAHSHQRYQHSCKPGYRVLAEIQFSLCRETQSQNGYVIIGCLIRYNYLTIMVV